MTTFREPLVPPFAALAAGIGATALVDFEPAPAFAGMGALVAIAIAARWRGLRRASWMALLAAILCLGIALAALRRPGPPPVIDFAPGETMILSGCIVDPPSLFPDHEQFAVELEPGARVRVNWYLKEGDTAPALRYGQRVELEARLRRPRNFRNPGAFDFAGYLARRDIYWTAVANPKSPVKIEGECGSAILGAIFRFRTAITDRLDRLYHDDPYSRGLSRALLAGDDARLEDIWAEDYRRTGTYHALVISGLHLTVLAACFLFLLRVLSIGPTGSLVVTTALSWTYAILAGANAPIVRAAAGLTLFLVCRCLYREPRTLNILAAVGIGFLIADPAQLFDASFQLSFLSVGLIAAIAVPVLEATIEPYAQGMRNLSDTSRDLWTPPSVAQARVEARLLAETVFFRWHIPSRVTLAVGGAALRVFFFCANMLVVSAVVQLGLIVPMILYFHRVSLTGLTANLLIVPALNVAVVVGFGAVASGSAMLASAGALLMRLARAVAAWHAHMEPEGRVPDPPLAVILAFAVALAALGLSLRHARLRRLTVPLFLVTVAALAAPLYSPRTEPGWLEVTAIDVGQGDSLLAVAPNGAAMLIDTGGLPAYGSRLKPALDIGEDVVSPYLLQRGFRTLDVVALSHAHEDHIGGLEAVASNFRPREIWIGAFPDTPTWAALRKRLLARGTRLHQPRAGERRLWAGVAVEFLAPGEDYEPGPTARNNDSLAFRMDYGRRSFLFTGDLERAAEAQLDIARADVLKVAHHGSRTSTTDGFLDAARPTWAIISAGDGNLFRHPHPDVVARLNDRGIRTWRTDRDGQVRFLTDGQRWRIETPEKR